MSDILTNISDTISGLARRIRQLEAIEIPVIGGGGAGAPSDASYLTLALHAGLTAERRFVDGTDLTGVDLGANNTYTLNHDDTAVAPGVYGDATHVAQITVNQRGHLTKAADVVIAGVAPLVHNVLDSTYHGDVLTGAVVRGDILYVNATPKIARLAKGTSNAVLTCDANDTLWSTYFLSGTAGQTYTFSATGGTVPTGSGTANYVTRWATTTTLGNSIIRDDATTASIGVAPVANQILTIKTATATNDALILQTSDNNTTKKLIAFKSSGGTILTAIAPTGEMTLALTPTTAALTYNGIDSYISYTPAGASNGTITAIQARVESNGAQDMSSTDLVGVTGTAYHFGTNTIGNVYGINLRAGNYSTGTTNYAQGVYIRIGSFAAGGTLKSAYGVHVATPLVTGAFTGTYMAISLDATTGAWGATKYGLYIYNFSGATNNYAIYTNSGLIRLGDQVSIVGSADRQQFLCAGYSTQAVGTALGAFTRADAAAGVSSILSLTGLGSGANGDGIRIDWFQKTSTTADQASGRIAVLWIDATHATRTSAMPFYLVNSAAALAEVGRWKVTGLQIGSGIAATDYTLTFDGETNDGVLTWMEDEDWFLFGDAVKTDNGRYRKITTYTDTCNVLVTDEVIIFNKATAFTATMPTAVVGQDFYLKNIGAGNVTLSFPGVDTVDEVDSDPIMTQYDALHLVCRTANAWVKV